MQPDYMVVCPECGGERWEHQEQTRDHDLFRCRNCSEETSFLYNDAIAVESFHEDCPDCATLEQELVERRHDHVIAMCTMCGTVQEAWTEQL